MKRILLFAICLMLMPRMTFAQFGGGGGPFSPQGTNIVFDTVANLPSSPSTNDLAGITDGADESDCTVGTGTDQNICIWSGSAWLIIGDGTAAASSGDSVTVNGVAVDTTANFKDGDIEFDIADGGPGGPDDITATYAADSIGDPDIDFGTGAGQVSAVDIPIADSGSIITAAEVEGALQENRTAIDLNTTHKTSDGSDHSFINQNVTTTGSPTFTAVTVGTINLGKFIATPDFDQSITSAGDTISNVVYHIEISSDAEYTMTSVPTIVDGADGEQILLHNTGLHAITLQDSSALPGSNLRLDGFSGIIEQDGTMLLHYSVDSAHWSVISGQTAQIQTSSAGIGIEFFNSTPVITAAGTGNGSVIASLTRIPVTTSEQTVSGTAVSNTVRFASWLFDTALGRTSLDAGIWEFHTFAAVNTITGNRVTVIVSQIYKVTPNLTGTVTMTGAGTSRTATASAGTPFAVANIDASATNTDASYLQTTSGSYQITARTSDTIVTITTLTGYVNDSAVTFNVWKKLFGDTSATIVTTGTDFVPYVHATSQSAFPIAITDKIGSMNFVTSNNTTTVTMTHDGTERNSHISTPLATFHGELAGLQGGTGEVPNEQYYHLTLAEYNGSGTGVFARVASPTFAGITIADGAFPTVTMTTNGVIETNGSIIVNIDSDDNLTTQFFAIRHNSTGSGGTDLFVVEEDGTVTITGTLDVSGDATANNLSGTNTGDQTLRTDGRSTTLNGNAIDADAELYTLTKCAIIETPTSADNFMIYHVELGAQVISAHCIVEDATSATIEFEQCDVAGDNCTVITTAIVCDVGGQADDGVIDAPDLDIDDWVRLDVTATDGTPGAVTACFTMEMDD